MFVWGVLILCLGFFAGYAFADFNHRRDKDKPVVQTSSPHGGDEKYGHPYPVVTYVRRELPTPPSGYLWELKVNLNDQGHHILTVALLKLATSEVWRTHDVNLTMDKYRPWAEKSRQYPSIKKNMFDCDILAPLVGWATLVINQVTANEAVGTDAPTDYTLG